KTGAIKTTPGHFVYASGDHGGVYIDKKEIFKDSAQTSVLCEQVAEHFKNLDIDTVVGPESGGIIMANWVAIHSSRLKERMVDTVHLFKKGSFMKIKQGDERKMVGKKILLVDDIATTGGSLKKCAQVICETDGLIAGIGLLWLRGNKAMFSSLFEGIPVFPLIRVRLHGWNEEDCLKTGPCSRGVPINIEYGHGAEFIKKHPEFKAVTDIPFIAGNNSPV
ncbi:MAG: phosphoribosyltransferase family protein, partial [Patescibacteria group bacterium]